MTKTWRSREAEYFHGYSRRGKIDAVRDETRRRERNLPSRLRSRDLKGLAEIEEDEYDDEG